MSAQPAPRARIRRARLTDLPALLELEKACFEEYRRASPASLRRSLGSPHQSVWVALSAGRIVSLLVLWHFPHRIRVYDVATHPDARHAGLGRALMAHTEALARKARCTFVSLEAEAANKRLVAWYRKQGYPVVASLPGFYPGGRAAVRMRKRLA